MLEVVLSEARLGRFRVHRARQLADGIKMARLLALDIAVLDLGLPDSGGLDTVRLFRQAVPLLPVIVLTGHDRQELGLEALRLNVQDFLLKSELTAELLPRALVYGLERAQMQRRLLQSDRLAAIGQLAAGLAHEVNNPAAFVMTNVGLLEEDLPELMSTLAAAKEAARRGDPGAAAALLSDRRLEDRLAEWPAMLAESKSGMERIGRLMRDLRAFAQTEDGAPEPLSLNEVVQSCASLLRNELRHRVEVIERYRELPQLRLDRRKLVQVLTHLLLAAADAADAPSGPPSQQIEISTEEIDHRAAVHIGVPRERLGSPVDPDARPRPRPLEPVLGAPGGRRGTGLSLSLVAELVVQLGAELIFAGPSSASFSVYFPVRSTPALESAPEPVLSRPTERPRVLVVDDEPLLLSAFRRVLGSDHEVQVALGAMEALQVLRTRQRFTAIVCDLMMPGMDGPSFYEHVASAWPELTERFIFLSGGAFTDRARSFVAGLPRPVLDKPIDWGRLRWEIARIASALALEEAR